MLNSNLKRAFAALMQTGGLHRADLARAVGITRTTSTNIINTLLSAGLVCGEFETNPPPEGEVRLKEKIRVAPAAGLLASITTLTRATSIAIGTLDSSLLLVESWPEQVDRPGRDRLLDACRRLKEQHGSAWFAQHPLRETLVTVNVQTDRDTGDALSHDETSVWLDTNPRQVVAHELGLTPIVENAARLQGFTAWIHDNERAAPNLLYVHLSHGVGMSHVVGGRLVTGSRGGNGEIGHMVASANGTKCWCGKRGCLTNSVSLPTLAAKDDIPLHHLTPGTPGASAPQALRPATVAAAGRLAGRVLGDVCNLLGPDVLVVGGELARYGDILLDPLADEARKGSLPLVGRHLQVLASQSFDDPRALARAAMELIIQNELEDLVDQAVDGLGNGSS